MIRDLMRMFRRRLASGALALSVLQMALLFAAPVSACCDPAAASHRAAHAALGNDENAPDCCPPGAHPPGECPLHSRSHHGTPGASRQTHCRFTCDMPHGPQFVLGAIGVLPAPAESTIRVSAGALHAVHHPLVLARPASPDAPPPRLL